MTSRPPAERPTLILSLFDQKETTSKLRKANLGYDASGVIRYLARLELLPGPYSGRFDIVRYLARDDAVAAFAFENFNLDDLASMARELEGDAKKANSKVISPWIHGCASVKISPEDFEGDEEDLVDLVHDLMKLFGVSENRYIIAVHKDSDHIHVHFLYSRIGPLGGLRERDRRHPKFMAEEACARLAHDYGFDLEDRHLSRVINGEIVDLASRRVVRNGDFDEVPAGMIKRNDARKKVGKNDLYKLALVADHVADGHLDEFRWRLAKHGILYEPKGSGAEFIDADESEIKASDLDYRFSKGRILGGACAESLPPTPPEIVQLAISRRPLPHDCDAEVARFMADRGARVTPRTTDEERWDQAVKIAMKKDRRGAPPRSPDLPGWPERMNVAGTIGARSRKPARLHFSKPYRVQEREWQTEVWNGRDLIATVRYSRMAILSKRDDDLRASLLAAKAAWGTIEVFGNPKFKRRVVALAAELNIQISNPELADAIIVASADHGPATWKVPETAVADGQNGTGSPASADHTQPITAEKPDGVPRYANDASTTRTREAHALRLPEDRTGSPPPGAPIVNTEIQPLPENLTANPKLVPASGAKPKLAEPPTDVDNPRIEALYASIERNRWRLIPSHRDGFELITVKPNTKLGFGIADEDLAGAAIQARLKKLYEQQQADKATILQSIVANGVQVSPGASLSGNDSVSMKVQTADRILADLFTQYQHHHDLHESLHQLYRRQQTDRARTEAKRRLERGAAHSVSLDSSINGEDAAPPAFIDGETRHHVASDEEAAGDHHKQVIDTAESASRMDEPPLRKSPPDADALRELQDIKLPASPPPSERRAESGLLGGAGNPDAIQSQDAKRLDYEALQAADLADLRKPRIFGVNGGSRLAEARPSTPADAPIPESSGKPLPVAKEQPANPVLANPHEEAAKAAQASGKQK